MKRLLFIIFFASLSLLFLHPINAGDFFHHLNTGRFIVQHHALPYTDDLSFTAFGQPWVAYAWGSGLLFYVIYTLFGPSGISVLFALFGALTGFFVYLTLRNLEVKPKIALVLTFLACSLISLRWPTRPEVLGPLFISALLFQLTYFKKIHWSLVPFFWLWAIMYGSSAFLGIAILVFYIVVKKLFNWQNLMIVGVCLIASLLNGYGLSSFLYIFQIPNIAPHVGEWLPITAALNPKIPEVVLFYQYLFLSYGLFVLFLALVTIVGVLKKRSLLSSHLFYVGIAVGILAPFYTNRFINLSPILVIPLIGLIINALPKKLRLFLIAVGLILAISITMVRFWKLDFGTGLEKGVFQPKVVSFLKEHKLNGNIFNSQEIGAWLSWELPKSKVFVDTRDDLYEPVGIFKKLQQVDAGEVNILNFLDTYHTDIVIGDFNSTNAYKPLFYTPKWQLVYLTDGYFIVIRRDLLKPSLIPLTAIDPLRNPPSKPGEENEASQELIYLLKKDPDSVENQFRLIELLLTQSKTKEAKDILEKIPPSTFSTGQPMVDIGSLELRGKVYLAQKDCDKAFDALNKADKLSHNQLIYFPNIRLPTVVDRYLGDYYLNCVHDAQKAKTLFLQYLQQEGNPLERRRIEQKIESIDAGQANN